MKKIIAIILTLLLCLPVTAWGFAPGAGLHYESLFWGDYAPRRAGPMTERHPYHTGLYPGMTQSEPEFDWYGWLLDYWGE